MTSVEDRLTKIETDAARILESLEALNQPVYPGRTTADSFSYWSDDAEPSRTKSASRGLASLRLPEGYKPYSVWKSFGDWIKEGIRDPGGFRQKHFSIFKTVQGMSEGVGADGGFAVLPEFNQSIFDRVYGNDLFSRTDHYTVSGNNMTFPKTAETSRAHGSRHGGLRGYWVSEGANIPASKPELAELSLKLKKLAVVVYLTDEMVEDSGLALEAYITRKASEEFNFLIGDALINGIGGGQPLGILNSSALVSVAKEDSQPADTIVAENVLNMWARLYAPARTNAVWLINQDTEPELHKMSLGVSTAGGQLVYMPPGGLSGAPYATLMGRPVIPTEFNATLGEQGDILLANLGDYVTVSKGGVSQTASIHVEFLTDQLAVRFIMRVDGAPWADSPITPYKGTATQSSFVTLDERA